MGARLIALFYGLMRAPWRASAVAAFLSSVCPAPVPAQMLSGVAEAPAILFVGRSFDIHRGIVPDVQELVGRAYRVVPLPVSVPLTSGEAPDLARVDRVLAENGAKTIVLSALALPDAPLGSDRHLVAHLTLLAEHMGRQGAEVLLLAHPPAKPERSLGYGNDVRRIERLIHGVAGETGARLVPVGAFFAALPHGARMDLYHARGSAYSEMGQRAVALMIAVALGQGRADFRAETGLVPPEWWPLAREVVRAAGER